MAQTNVQLESVSTIVLVDDHPMLREGLAEYLNKQDGLEVIGQAESTPEALVLIRDRDVDLAIIDISLKESNGLELIKEIHPLKPDLKICVYSMHDEAIYAERVVNAGARGYITKGSSSDTLLNAVRTILSGDVYLSPDMTKKVIGKLAERKRPRSKYDVDLLSDRELEVFHFLGRGFSSKQIAEKLSLSPRTIDTYREHIKNKLGINNATELVNRATKWVSQSIG